MAVEKFTLSDAQKALILEKYQGGVQDMNMLTQLTWEDPSIDGRHAKGRAVKKFLVENELKYKTLHHEVVERIELTPEQGQIILAEARKGKTHLEVAKVVWPDKDIKKLSQEWRMVLNYITAHAPEISLDKTENDNTTSYFSPKEAVRVVKKINEIVGVNLDPEKLSPKYKQYVEKLTTNLGNMRFVRICNSYTARKDRDLFEFQFVLLTWDKPDLTADELNLYMSVCKDIVTGECLSGHINTLNNLFENMEDAGELTMRFSETLKAKTDEYSQCQKRVADTIKKLQGDRSEKLKNQKKDDTNFISIVQMAQDENERKNMLRLAELQRAAISEEAKRLESMEEWKCRILGISKEDVI